MALEHRVSIDDKAENGYISVQEPSELKMAKPTSAYAVKSPLMRECLAEFIGTFILLCFGDGVVAQVVLSGGHNGDYTHINLCWGIAVLFGIHFSGGVSGAHLNPAVTTTLAVFKRFEWRKVPAYILAQMLGAFFGALVVYVVYYPMFNQKDPLRETTMGVFATYPGNEFITTGNAFLTEVVGSALLLGGIFAIGDQLNKPASPYSAPGAVALLVVAIGMAFGMNSGYAINPARDFGPRVFSSFVYGAQVFQLAHSYFWVPLVAPLIGGVLGAAVYVGFVELHHPHQE